MEAFLNGHCRNAAAFWVQCGSSLTGQHSSTTELRAWRKQMPSWNSKGNLGRQSKNSWAGIGYTRKLAARVFNGQEWSESKRNIWVSGRFKFKSHSSSKLLLRSAVYEEACQCFVGISHPKLQHPTSLSPRSLQKYFWLRGNSILTSRNPNSHQQHDSLWGQPALCQTKEIAE